MAEIVADGRLPVLIPAFNNPTYVAGMVAQLLRFPELRPVVLAVPMDVQKMERHGRHNGDVQYVSKNSFLQMLFFKS